MQILTDNGKVFTGRFNHPPVEVLFDAICRENGIEHLLTQPRSPTTTGKIERLHRSMRAEFLAGARPFASLKAAQVALDEWVADYNTRRPHQFNMDRQCPVGWWTSDRCVLTHGDQRVVLNARRFGVARRGVCRRTVWRR